MEHISLRNPAFCNPRNLCVVTTVYALLFKVLIQTFEWDTNFNRRCSSHKLPTEVDKRHLSSNHSVMQLHCGTSARRRSPQLVLIFSKTFFPPRHYITERRSSPAPSFFLSCYLSPSSDALFTAFRDSCQLRSVSSGKNWLWMSGWVTARDYTAAERAQTRGDAGACRHITGCWRACAPCVGTGR